MKISSKELCDGLPIEFEEFLDYVKKLDYDEKPNYEKLRKFFDSIMKREQYKYDYIYDWTTLEEQENRKNIIRNRTDPTNGDTLTYPENEKKINYNDFNNFNIDEEVYYIQRNHKSFLNYLDNHDSAVCCTSSCNIF